MKEIAELFVKVLVLAREMGVLKLGTVALDGTKIHANASRHSALSYEHAGKLEAQLKAEVGMLLVPALAQVCCQLAQDLRAVLVSATATHTVVLCTSSPM